LHSRELDIAITARPSKARLRGLHFEPLARYRLAIAVPPNHPFTRLRVVKLARLAKEPVLAYDYAAYPEYLDDLNRFFSSAGSKPRIVEEHDSVSSLITAIAAGRGVALVPETIVYMSGTRLCLVPTQPAPAPVSVGMICRAGKPPAIVTDFIAGAKASLRVNG
jgi:DNA-binding transcriptional LysR family regulator